MLLEILIGFVIALAIGLTGVGGGTLTVPVLILALGLPPVEAVGTALVYVTATKLLASGMYLQKGQIEGRVLGLLLAGGIPGVIAGSLVLQGLKSSSLHQFILVLVGGTIALVAGTSLWRLLVYRERGEGRERSRWLPLVAMPIGAEVGFSSAGAGALGSLALMEFTKLRPAQIIGTDLVFGLAISAIGAIFHFVGGSYAPGLLVNLIIGGCGGALLGSWLGSRVPGRPLRIGLTFFLALLGTQLFWRGLTAVVR